MTSPQLSEVASTFRTALEQYVNDGPIALRPWAREKLIDFRVWADGLGLFAASRNSLQSRLSDYAEARETLLDLVTTLTEILQERLSHDEVRAGDGISDRMEHDAASMSGSSGSDMDIDEPEPAALSPWSDESQQPGSPTDNIVGSEVSSDFAEAQRDFASVFQRLFHLGTIIRQSGTASRLLKADKAFDPNLYPALQAHLECMLRVNIYRGILLEESEGPTSSTQSVIERILSTELRAEHASLINTNLRRRHRFLFARKRANSLAERPAESPTQSQAIKGQESLTPSELPRVHEHSSYLRERAQNEASVVSRGQASVSTVDPAMLTLPSKRPEDDMPAKSLFSSQFTSTGTGIMYPRPPPISMQEGRDLFSCPCCYQTLPTSIGKREASQKWKNHIKKDLMPYQCPFPGCGTSAALFARKYEWKSHCMEQHQTTTGYKCPLCDDALLYDDSSQFESHVHTKHHTSVPETYMETMVTFAARKRFFGLTQCPVCATALVDGDMDHLAACIHQFSMRSLPWNDAIPDQRPGLERFGSPDLQRLPRLFSWLTSIEVPSTTPMVLQSDHLPPFAISHQPSIDPIPSQSYFSDAGPDSSVSSDSSVTSTSKQDWEVGGVCGACGAAIAMLMKEDALDADHGRIMHHANIVDLATSEESGCPTCAVFKASLRLPADGDEPLGPFALVPVPQSFESNDAGYQEGFTNIVYEARGALAGGRRHNSRFDIAVSAPSQCRILGRITQENFVQTAQRWLQTCDRSHAKCHSTHSETRLPARCIDVQSSPPRLVETEGQEGLYCTLSHCWGEHLRVLLKSQNFHAMLDGLPMNDISYNFRDAISVTRALGIRFLWIDALCILQDSQEDWTRNAAHMDEIYARCTLAIAAMEAPHHDYGFLDPREAQRTLRAVPKTCQVRLYQPGSNLHVSLTAESSGIFGRKYPLASRAWAFSELLLVPRVLYFTNEMVYFECPTSDCFSDLWYPVPPRSRKHGAPTSMRPFDFDFTDTQALSENWYNIVQHFSGLHLTFRSDRSHAMSGLARRIAESQHREYCAGLWRDDLLAGLMWTVAHSGPFIHYALTWDMQSLEEDTYSRPSWSWISVISGVFYTYAKFSWDFKATVLSCQVVPQGQNPYGSLESAQLELKGSFIRLNKAAPHQKIPEDYIGPHEPWYFLLATDPDLVLCLVLEKAQEDDRDDVYQRCGILCFDIASWARVDLGEAQIIRLI